jgi:hypothetical protein
MAFAFFHPHLKNGLLHLGHGISRPNRLDFRLEFGIKCNATKLDGRKKAAQMERFDEEIFTGYGWARSLGGRGCARVGC